MVIILGVRRPFGRQTERAGRRPCPLRLIWTGWGIVGKEITVPNLLYCSNFSYCFLSTWSRGGWQYKVAIHESAPTLVWSFKFTMGGQSTLVWLVMTGMKVYWVYRAGGQPAPQTTLNSAMIASALSANSHFFFSILLVLKLLLGEGGSSFDWYFKGFFFFFFFSFTLLVSKLLLEFGLRTSQVEIYNLLGCRWIMFICRVEEHIGLQTITLYPRSLHLSAKP